MTSTFKISQDLLEKMSMDIRWRVHKLAQLIDRKGDVKSSKYTIL